MFGARLVALALLGRILYTFWPLKTCILSVRLQKGDSCLSKCPRISFTLQL